MWETIRNVLYLLAQAILWGCIVMDIRAYRQSKRLSQEYEKAIKSANEAREAYLQKAEEYDRCIADINEERDYFRNLQEQEAAKNEE